MQFSDTINKAGLIQDCELIIFGEQSYGAISDNPTRLITFTNLLNRASDKTASLIMEADTRWQWDDSNNTDYPIAVTNLVAGQKDYTFSLEHLKILRIEVQDSNGDWLLLSPIDEVDIKNQAVSDFLSTNGTPLYYDKLANSFFLYPTPSVSVISGLKVFYQRGPNYFNSSDTTKVPGFNSLFHRLLSLYASYDYALLKQMPISLSLSSEISKMEQELQDFFALRNKDERVALTVRTKSFR